MKVNDDINVLKKLLPKFLFHCYIKDKQSDYCAKLKYYIKQDPTRVLVHNDFAENYTLAYQDEVQSAHWTNYQVTIFSCYLASRYNDVICCMFKIHTTW